MYDRFLECISFVEIYPCEICCSSMDARIMSHEFARWSNVCRPRTECAWVLTCSSLKVCAWIGFLARWVWLAGEFIVPGGESAAHPTASEPASLASWQHCTLDFPLAFSWVSPSVPGFLDFSQAKARVLLRTSVWAILLLGSGHIWMNQRPSSFNQDNDKINLAISYQGFSISVVGPASKALDFVNKLIPDYQVNQLPVARGLQSSSSPASVPTTLVHSEPCPDSVLALATRLSAAGISIPEKEWCEHGIADCSPRHSWDPCHCPQRSFCPSTLPTSTLWSCEAVEFVTPGSSRTGLILLRALKAWSHRPPLATSSLRRQRQEHISRLQASAITPGVEGDRLGTGGGRIWHLFVQILVPADSRPMCWILRFGPCRSGKCFKFQVSPQPLSWWRGRMVCF